MAETKTVRLPGRPAPPPLTLYIHVPWCVSKCPYCDFNSHVAPLVVPEDRYVEAVRRDLEGYLPEVCGRPVHSIFLGGGTPSLLRPESIARILSDVRMLLTLVPGAEITMEANPGTVDAGRFMEFADAGVNRLSLGVQSFNDPCLQALGRVHDAEQARAAAELAVATFARVNLDLMYAIPGQDVDAAVADVQTACALGVEHLSLYYLMLEPGAEFYRRRPVGLPDEDLAADIDDAVRATAGTAGYERYEASAYSKDGGVCRHNLNYWRFGDYLGIGAGAHAKITSPDGVRREMRHKAPDRYLERTAAGAPVAVRTPITRSDLPFEFMLNALRLVDGFEVDLFEQRTALPLQVVASSLNEAVARGWLEQERGKIRPTATGLDFLVDLCALFLPSSSRATHTTSEVNMLCKIGS